jgi:dephospho-CoA kinase
MRILGLTGSIGMGKSVAASLLRRLGVPVHDADQVVHQAMSRHGSAVKAVDRAFPGVVVKGVVDRKRLGGQVFGKPAALKRLEAILHPIVRRSAQRFLEAAARRRAKLVALDIPLLFETGGEKRCDAVVVMSAPAFLQRQRVLRRGGMDAEKLERILARQLPDVLKRRRADDVILSGLNRRRTLESLARIVRRLKHGRPSVWRPGYGRGG